MSSSVAALWHAMAIAPDNGMPLVSFLVSCGSEARHLCEAAHELLVSLFCYAPELVAPVLVERLTCESTLQLFSTCNGAAVQDAFVQRDGVCSLLVEVALAAPSALQCLLPPLVAFALPRIDSAECSSARALLARACEILVAGATDNNRPYCDSLRSFATRLVDPKAPLDLWWTAESTLLEPPLVAADVPLPTRLYKEGPGSVAATDFLKALTPLMSQQQMSLLGSQLLGWALRYQDMCLSLRTLELFLVVLRPLDVAAIDSHVCSLLETLTELERLPAPSASHRLTDLQFSQRRAKALMLLRALVAAVEETASADVLQKLFWCATALLDVPSLPFLPLLDGVLPLLNAVLRHPMWPAAEHQACVALAQRGADFEGLLWPLLRVRYIPFMVFFFCFSLEFCSESALLPSCNLQLLI